jgi:PleD family two-component response regulator
VMPDTTERAAVAHSEGWRFEASVAEVLTENHTVKFTVSVGVLEARSDWSATDVMRRAYRLVWEAQQAGGNRVAARGAHESAV